MRPISDDHDDVYRDFNQAVNMVPSELADWLDTDPSRSVGVDRGGESVGHESGRRILAIKATKKTELDDDDYEHMHKVVGYVHRHLAQKPETESIEAPAGAIL
jgi:hypothetical protein